MSAEPPQTRPETEEARIETNEARIDYDSDSNLMLHFKLSEYSIASHIKRLEQTIELHKAEGKESMKSMSEQLQNVSEKVTNALTALTEMHNSLKTLEMASAERTTDRQSTATETTTIDATVVLDALRLRALERDHASTTTPATTMPATTMPATPADVPVEANPPPPLPAQTHQSGAGTS